MTCKELAVYVSKQVENVFCCKIEVDDCIKEAVKQTRMCLLHSNNKYKLSMSDDQIPFSVFNSVHYCIFLYFLSHELYLQHGDEKAEKIYYLNKLLNSVDLFYRIELPSIWLAEHPLGSVMGRASYSDFFFFYQGCTVGGNISQNGIAYPVLGKNVVMYSNSKILGDCQIGDNVILSANTYVINQKVPSNSVVFGQSPNIVIKEKTESEMNSIMSHFWNNSVGDVGV